MERHERHDERLVYEAWVPPGSLARGRRLARRGAPGVPACIACHGADLRGTAAAPPIAGRFSTLLRQLIAFRTGARAGEGGQAMRVVAAELALGDMIAAAAYAASLPP
jgi:cytochrome c553